MNWKQRLADALDLPGAPRSRPGPAGVPQLWVIEGPKYGMVYGIPLTETKKPVIAMFTSPADADWFISECGLDRGKYVVSAGMPPSGLVRFFKDARRGNWSGACLNPRRGSPVTWFRLEEGVRRAKELETA